MISSAILVQLHELEAACDPGFLVMSRTQWPSVNQVSGYSAFTNDIIRGTEQVIEFIKPHVEQKKYLRNFFDKAYGYAMLSFLG